jgi:hypothetical protein
LVRAAVARETCRATAASIIHDREASRKTHGGGKHTASDRTNGARRRRDVPRALAPQLSTLRGGRVPVECGNVAPDLNRDDAVRELPVGRGADHFGLRPTLAACGLVVLLFGLTVGLRSPRLREI